MTSKPCTPCKCFFHLVTVSCATSQILRDGLANPLLSDGSARLSPICHQLAAHVCSRNIHKSLDRWPLAVLRCIVHTQLPRQTMPRPPCSRLHPHHRCQSIADPHWTCQVGKNAYVLFCKASRPTPQGILTLQIHLLTARQTTGTSGLLAALRTR